ncbi:DUF397 domain-containing protein [Streptomyces sp. NPDC094038]|uniref:DUF397 domain-containing protein n=1 Tax=Streptomyces sp. NPDC094038 TaxID=3366055 RepID=UPI003823A143
MTSMAPHWFKSSYSNDGGGACLEVAVAWRRSTHSGSEGGACVEVAACPHAVHVRDSKNPAETGPTLTASPAVWAAFTVSVG